MSAPFRIVVVADSLALPRDEDGEVLRWEETWPYLLERAVEGVEVINCGARARSSAQLDGGEYQEHVVFKKPQAIIVQVGIVDCAPRIFTALEKRALKVAPAWLRQRVIARRAARRAEITRRDPLARVQTPPERFERQLTDYLARLRPLPVIALPIVCDPARMELKSPGHGGNVRLYNDRLRRACGQAGARFIEPDALIPDDERPSAFTRDGYHLNALGSRAVATRLAPLVRAWTAAAR